MSFPGWHQEVDENGFDIDVKPFPPKYKSGIAALLSIFASYLALLSMLWQHVASITFVTNVESMTYQIVKGHVGALGLMLGWLAAGAMILGSAGIVAMIVAINLLDKLTDE